MAETQTGLAVTWGVNNLTFTGIAVHTLGTMQEYSMDRSHDETELRDANGDVVGMASVNLKKTLNLTVVPSHSSHRQSTGGQDTSAANSMDDLMPQAGTVITVADSETSPIDEDPSGAEGEYLLLSARLRRTNNDKAVIEMSMEQFDDNDVAAAIT